MYINIYIYIHTGHIIHILPIHDIYMLEIFYMGLNRKLKYPLTGIMIKAIMH